MPMPTRVHSFVPCNIWPGIHQINILGRLSKYTGLVVPVVPAHFARLISCLPSHSCHPFPAFELDWPGARRKLMLAQRERNHGPINILALHIRAITILVSNVGIKNSYINVESNGRPCRTWPTMLNQYYSIRNHVPNPPFHALLQLYSMQIFSIIGTNWKEFALISYYTSFCNIPKNQLNLAKVRAKSSINIREEC